MVLFFKGKKLYLLRWHHHQDEAEVIMKCLPLFIFVPFISILAFGGSSFGKSRGEALYHLCEACHGSAGEGSQVLGAPAIAGLPEWYLEAQLKKFRDGSRGKHPDDLAGLRMRPMARTLSDSDITAAAGYVAGMKPSKELPPTVDGRLVKGEKQYEVCKACHGADGSGNQQLNSPPLTLSNDWYLVKQLENFKAGIRGGDPSVDVTGASMRPMATILDDQGMKDVVAYIQTLK